MTMFSTGFAAVGGERVHYDEYIARIDMRAVLSHYGAENISEIPGAEGTTELLHSCLLDRIDPHHANGDQNPSAIANVEKKIYVCRTSWGGGVLHFVARMERKESIREIVGLLGRFLDDTVDDPDQFIERLQSAFVKPDAYVPPPPVYDQRVLRPWAVVHPFVYSRGITDETASELQIGWRETDNRITIPHIFGGQLLGWQARAIPAGPDWPPSARQRPKYLSSPLLPRSTTLYNYDRARGYDHVIVVESPFSVIKAHSLGLPNVVATFGAKVSNRQVDLLRSFRQVTVWGDPDPAGAGFERRLVQGLWRHVTVDVVEPDPGRDLGDCESREEVEVKLAVAEPAPFALARYDDGRR